MNRIALVLLAVAVAGCENPDLAGDPATLARDAVQAYIDGELTALADAALAIQEGAPAPDEDGWNVVDDEGAVLALRSEWKRARAAYERVEGAIAVLFPELDAATDERWDGFIAEAADDNLFDGAGVIGNHAIERIVFSDVVPEHVLAFERALGDSFTPSRYSPPAFPADRFQAGDFKTGLTARFAGDTAQMRDDFAGVELALEAAFRGVLGSMEEQVEKVALAGTGEDESRYAQHTLADMRFNLEGGRVIFEAFEPMFSGHGDEGEALYQDILAAFDLVEAQYDALEGDAVPPVPATWNPDAPSPEDAATPYGKLFLFLAEQTDPDVETSFVHLLDRGAALLGIPALPE